MNETSISLLGRACSDPGAESWDQLADLYAPLLRAWMRKYGLQDSDMDDLTQDVLLTVSRELPSFEHSGRTGAFRSWLRHILVHRLQNFWRSRKYRPVATGRTSVLERLNELADETSDVSQLWNAEHDRHVLAELLQRVRPRFQDRTWEAFCRQMFAKEKGREVAAELQMTLKAVHLAKSRVLFALRTEANGLVEG